MYYKISRKMNDPSAGFYHEATLFGVFDKNDIAVVRAA